MATVMLFHKIGRNSVDWQLPIIFSCLFSADFGLLPVYLKRPLALFNLASALVLGWSCWAYQLSPTHLTSQIFNYLDSAKKMCACVCVCIRVFLCMCWPAVIYREKKHHEVDLSVWVIDIGWLHAKKKATAHWHQTELLEVQMKTVCSCPCKTITICLFFSLFKL